MHTIRQGVHCEIFNSNRAILGFLGVTRLVPNLAINGDIRWVDVVVETQLSMTC